MSETATGDSIPSLSPPAARPHADLRTEDWDQLDITIRRAKLSTEWQRWQRTLALHQAPHSVFHVARNGLASFALIDAWCDTRHVELAELVCNTIDEGELSSLRIADKQTPRGAAVGGQYLENPLRGALSLPNPTDSATVLAAGLALLLMAVAELNLEIPKSWIAQIATPAHNHASPDWAPFLALCPTPVNPHSLADTLAWAQTLSKDMRPSQRPFRPTENEFIADLGRLSRCIADGHCTRGRGAKDKDILSFGISMGATPEEEADAPETAARTAVLEIQPTIESATEAEEPDALLTATGEAIPESEPAQADAVQANDCIRTSFRSAAANQRLRYHWDTLPPAEVPIFIRSIEKDLDSPSPAEYIPAMANGLAVCFGCRPSDVWHAPVTDGSFPGLDLKRGVYIKAVPRPPHSWRPDDQQPCALLPSAEVVSLPLPKRLARKLRKHANPKVVGKSLLDALGLNRKEVEAQVREWLRRARQGTYHFTPRRIARILETAMFATSRRSVMTYWVACTHEDPPPSGAYYVAAPVQDVCLAYQRAIESIWSEAGEDPQLAAVANPEAFVGTRLIPPDDVVKGFVRHLREIALLPEDVSSWESVRLFHNRYTAYVVTLLMFATGHRPVDDAFDGHMSVAVDLGYALIDDKNIGRERSDRLVPLATIAAEQLRQYRAHLEHLYALIPKSCHELRRELESQLATPSARILPLFFFIDRQGGWQSVTPSALRAHYPDNWHYPNRVHRHLLATWFYQSGEDEEASAQMLGHVDAGTASLSPVSVHSPASLFAPLRLSIQRFLEHLGWQAHPGLPEPGKFDRPRPDARRLPGRCAFGTAVRRKRREDEERADHQEILALVARELGEEPEASLTQTHVRNLIDSVNARTALRSSRRGRKRMEALREILARIKREHRIRIKLPNLTKVIGQEESMFSASTLSHAQHAKLLRRTFLNQLDAMRTPLSAKDYPDERAAYALFAMIAFARVLDRDVLERVLKGAPYWLVKDCRLGTFVEIQVSLKNVRRYPIGTIALSLLADPCFSEEREDATRRAFEKLVARLTGADLRRNHDALPHIVERFLAEAKLELPGYLASYVSGESGSASLPRHAWLRFLTDKAPIKARLPQLKEPPDRLSAASKLSSEILPPDPSDTPADYVPETDFAMSRAHAIDFVEWVDNKISELWGTQQDENGKTRAKNKAPVTPLGKCVKEELEMRSKTGTLPPVAFLLGRWVERLCETGSKRGAVVASTIATYWSTVSRPLAERAHDVSLPELLSDALEDIYSRTLDDTDYQDPHQLLERLKLFHWFVILRFGAAEVDWLSVIPEGFPDQDMLIDAGIITQAEYRRALSLLENDPHTPELRDRLINCTCLILIWHFGLRISEAAGIRRKDISGELPNITARVCNDEFRRVKTDAALRHVPLVGELDEHEIGILRRWLEHIDHCHPDDHLAGLFAERDRGRTLISQSRISSRVTEALVAATGDPFARVHYGRHGFGSRGVLAMAVGDTDEDLTPFGEPEGIRARLLGNSAVSRRGLWAIAAMIGHAFPGTTLRYYAHLHDLALAALPQNDLIPTDRQLMNCLGIDSSVLGRIRAKGHASAHLVAVARACPDRVDECVEEWGTAALPRPRASAQRKNDATLQNVLRVIQVADKRARLENIGNRLLLAPELIESTINKALTICDEIEYGKTGDLPPADDLSRPEWQRLISASVPPGKKRALDSEQLSKIGEIWLRGYYPLPQTLLVRDCDELEILIRLFTELGLTEDQLEMRADPRLADESWCRDLILRAKQLGIRAIKSERIPLFPTAGRTRNASSRRVAVLIRESNAGPIRSAKAMHRLLLAVAVGGRLGH